MHAKTQYANEAMIWRLAPFLFLSLAAAYALLTIYVLVDGETTNAVTYTVLAFWFVVLATIYLANCGYDATSLCSIPAILTILALVGFIALPALRMINGNERLDDDYVRALSVVLVGFLAFWVGSWLTMKQSRLRFVPTTSSVPARAASSAFCMLIIGVTASVIEWKLGIYSYMADSQTLQSVSGIAQWLSQAAQLLSGAALVSGIEVLSKKNSSLLIKFIFYLSLGLMLGFGVISGMKSELLQPFLLVAMLFVLVKGRISRTIWIVVPFLFLAVYPFVTAYRANLNAGYRYQANTVSGMEATMAKSFEDAFAGKAIADKTTVHTSFDSSSRRLSLLSYVHDLVSMPSTSLLNGDEKVYLAPIYPFIPRFLWKDKPVLDKGHRVSVALGIPATSSTTLTSVGDMYALGGMLGVMFGMFLYGIGGQLIMNILGDFLSEKGVFFLVAMLPVLTDLESDVVSLIAGTVQKGVLVLLIAYVIYGGRLFSLRSSCAIAPGNAAA
jgi:hypothetical protein